MRRLALALSVLFLAGCGGDAPAEDAAVVEETAGAEGTAGDAVEQVDAGVAVALLEDRDDLTVIDVRTAEEFADGHLAEATKLDLSGGEFEEEIGDYDRDAAYLLYCRTGSRSAAAADLMAELGFTEVIDAGGYQDLADAGAETTA